MAKSHIILTFDYELFLGQNHVSAQEVLVAPTTSLLSKLKETDIKATFFIDLTYLLCIKKHLHKTSPGVSRKDLQKLEIEYNDVLENIDNMLLQGHELGMHFHPQWIDAIYIDGKWGFSSFEHYALHNLSKNEIDELFSAGIQQFNQLYKRTKTPKPSMLSFRAGGWCIHPFNKVRNQFLQHGITIDSSVTIPFKRTPWFYPGKIPAPDKQLKQRASWRFSADPLIEDKIGEFIEVPIDICFSTLPDLFKAQASMKPGDWKKRGKFIPGSTGIRKILSRFKKVLQLGEYTMLTLDVENASARFSQFQRYYKNTQSNKGFVFLSHPKQFGAPSMQMIDKLVESNQFIFLCLSDYVNISR